MEAEAVVVVVAVLVPAVAFSYWYVAVEPMTLGVVAARQMPDNTTLAGL